MSRGFDLGEPMTANHILTIKMRSVSFLLMTKRSSCAHDHNAEGSRSRHSGYAYFEDAGITTHARIRDYYEARTGEQWRLSGQCRIAVRCSSATRTRWF